MPSLICLLTTVNEKYYRQGEDIFAAAVREVKEETGVSDKLVNIESISD